MLDWMAVRHAEPPGALLPAAGGIGFFAMILMSPCDPMGRHMKQDHQQKLTFPPLEIV